MMKLLVVLLFFELVLRAYFFHSRTNAVSLADIPTENTLNGNIDCVLTHEAQGG